MDDGGGFGAASESDFDSRVERAVRLLSRSTLMTARQPPGALHRRTSPVEVVP